MHRIKVKNRVSNQFLKLWSTLSVFVFLCLHTIFLSCIVSTTNFCLSWFMATIEKNKHPYFALHINLSLPTTALTCQSETHRPIWRIKSLAPKDAKFQMEFNLCKFIKPYNQLFIKSMMQRENDKLKKVLILL